VGQKSEATPVAIILPNRNRFAEFFFTGRFLGKFAVNWLLKIPPLIAYVAFEGFDVDVGMLADLGSSDL